MSLNELGKKELTELLYRTFGKYNFDESELTEEFYNNLFISGNEFFKNGGDTVNLDFFWSPKVKEWILTDKESWYREHVLSTIVKIVIKSASGYGPADEAYEDKLTITSSSISYEYKPHPMSESETNIYRKWSYQTTSPIFEEIYRGVVEMTPHFLYNNEILFCTDIGPTTITAIFADKHRETVNYFAPSEFFEDYFRVIKLLVPKTEYTPAVLLTNEDFEDNCE